MYVCEGKKVKVFNHVWYNCKNIKIAFVSMSDIHADYRNIVS